MLLNEKKKKKVSLHVAKNKMILTSIFQPLPQILVHTPFPAT